MLSVRLYSPCTGHANLSLVGIPLLENPLSEYPSKHRRRTTPLKTRSAHHQCSLLEQAALPVQRRSAYISSLQTTRTQRILRPERRRAAIKANSNPFHLPPLSLLILESPCYED